jgi:hypothetical protein
MPAVTLWFFALGGAALARSLRLRRRRRSRNDPRRILVRVAGVIACLALVITPARLALSDARLNAAIDNVRRGDCTAARGEATDAIGIVGQRPTPYQLIAFCDMREARYRPAVVQMRRALQRDPHNWELFYGLAVARAGAGLDPRSTARRARMLNPLDQRAATAPVRFRGDSRDGWKLAAQTAPLLPPAPGDP